tara:strand:+ start:1792 stop:2394 length:603 start_codon:yes stop_codon:yes gene_type:complete
MQDGGNCNSQLRALVNLSGALAGLMMILVGGMVPSGILLPTLNNPTRILDLPTSWQVPSLLLCALMCGARSAVIASIAYLTIGLFYIPIFQNGGLVNYLNDPSFGYLIGFIPAGWLTGRLSRQKGMNNLVLLTLSALGGLALLHGCGVLNLIIGSLRSKWDYSLTEMLFIYSFAQLPGQIVLCPAVGIVALSIRRILFIK